MAGEWYCLIGDREYGPLDGHKLRHLAQSGQLSEESLVRKGADGHWVTANHVVGLFAAHHGDVTPSIAAPPAPVPEPPQVGNRLMPNVRAALIGFAAACAVFTVAGLAYYFGRHSAAPSAADRSPADSAARTPAAAPLANAENQSASTKGANLEPSDVTDVEQVAPKNDAVTVTPNFTKKDPNSELLKPSPDSGGTSDVSTAKPASAAGSGTITKEHANVVASNSTGENVLPKPELPPADTASTKTTTVQHASAVETVLTAPKDQLVSISPNLAKDEARPLPKPAASTPTRDATEIRPLLADARQSVAAIQVRRGKKEGDNVGLGFLVAPRMLVTNYHIIEGARGVKITFPGRDMVYGKGFYKIDEERDLALIECETGDLKPIGLASSRPTMNDSVHAMASNGAIASGAIGALGKSSSLNAFMMQSTATISPESSGGPLMNDNGEAAGITTTAFKGGKRFDLAISSEHVADLLASAGKKSQLWSRLPPPRPPQQPPSNTNASPQEPNMASQPSSGPPQQFGDSQAISSAESLVAAIKESQQKSDQSAAVQGELNRIQQQISALSNVLATLQSQYNDLTTRKGEVATRRANMFDRARQAHIRRDQLQQSLQTAQNQLNQAIKNNQNYQIGALNQQISGLQSNYNFAAQQYASLLASWRALDQEVKGFEQRINETSFRGNQAIQELSQLRRAYDKIGAQ